MAGIEQLEWKVKQLAEEVDARVRQIDSVLQASRRTLDVAMHVYKLDNYGYLWVWDPDTQTYHRSKMRVMSPEIVDRAIHTRHIADGAVTEEKLDDAAITADKIHPEALRDFSNLCRDFKDWVIETLTDRKPIVTMDEADYDRVSYLYEKDGIVAVDKDGVLYLLDNYDGEKFVFTHHDENGDILYINISATGWDDSIAPLQFSTGPVHHDIVEEMTYMATEYDFDE